MMRNSFRVRYGTPDPNHRDYALRLLNLTYWVDIDGEEDPESRRLKGNNLLNMLNGDWRETTFVHYCKLGCCKTNEEAFSKAWSAVRNCVFGQWPGTPAMNKWTACFLVKFPETEDMKLKLLLILFLPKFLGLVSPGIVSRTVSALALSEFEAAWFGLMASKV